MRPTIHAAHPAKDRRPPGGPVSLFSAGAWSVVLQNIVTGFGLLSSIFQSCEADCDASPDRYREDDESHEWFWREEAEEHPDQDAAETQQEPLHP